MRVFLISANPERTPFPVFPIGISYVARALEDRHEVRLWDALADEGLPEALAAFDPHLVGLSLRNVDGTRPDGRFYLDHYRDLARSIRRAHPAPLVLGGAAFTLFPGQYLEALQGDYGIVGEGEHLRALVDALEDGKDPRDWRVSGLVLPGREPGPTWNWTGPIGHARAAADLAIRHGPSCGGVLNLQTKRGCNFRCVYCTYPAVEGRHLRYRSPDDLVQEALRLKALGARHLFLVDSVLNLQSEGLETTCKAFSKAPVGLPFSAYLAPFRISEALAMALREAGMTHAELGTESLSDPVLRAYGKPFRWEDVRAAHETLGRAGIHRAHFLLFGGPGETPETVEETLARSRELRDTVFFPYRTLRIFPGTPLHRRALAEGLVHREDDLFRPVFYCSPQVDPEWLRDRLRREAEDRPNFVLDDASEELAALVARAHARGRSGPMWERLCR
ncbi:MAG TPA: radical SAM protein [Myxococcota bacterium]|nr:radical SAM protein [Myxococcota bacterium]HQK50839.1 radical SAM protein [Myxococcota bacterium]